MGQKPDRPRLGIAALTLATSVGLCGCLADALWGWYDPERVPDLETSTHRLLVRDVRAPDGDITDRLAVAVSPSDPEQAPAHVGRIARERAAWLRLFRYGDVSATRAGALTAFEPRTFDIDVFDGEHLDRATFNARLRIYGEVPRPVLGRELAPEAVPWSLRDSRLRVDNVLGGGLVGRILDGFAAQRWLTLVADEPEVPGSEQVPVAFLDHDGMGMSPEQMRDALLGVTTATPLPKPEHCVLLGRVDEPGGRTRFVEVPVELLLEAAEMEFVRDGDRVAYAHDQAWWGRFDFQPLAAAWPRPSVSLRSTAISYRWSDELSNDRPLLYAISTALTPIAAILDFVLASNAAVADLLREMAQAIFRGLPPKRSRTNR